MAANPERRTAITDAAVEVLGALGSRGLTHRAVDTAAGLPLGSTANYFPSRSALVLAMAERVFERLSPDRDRLADLEKIPQERATQEYAVYAAERLLGDRSLALALIELQLEAARRPDVREVLEPFLRQGFAQDTDFHEQRGLPGGGDTVLALRHAVMGVVLDALTVPLDPARSPVDEIRRIAAALAG